MLRSLFIFIAVLISPLTLHATEVMSGKFTFHLDGEWNITKDEKGTITAVQQTKESGRAFILSVVPVSSSNEIIDTLLYLRNYLDTLSNENNNLVKNVEFTQYKTKSGAPFNYVAYTEKSHNGFFIGATLGSNSGVLLVTYGGNGSYKIGIGELKNILSSMKVI